MSADEQMTAYYLQGKEQDRLVAPKGSLEAARTKEILLRRLPAAPATVADIGGGPGHYSLWLADLGHDVVHRDLMPNHVDQLRAARNSSVRTAVGDAREVDLPDSSVDAVLLLGPLYHLPDRGDRVRALQEARRIVRDGGPVFVAVISRWAARLDGVVQERLYERSPEFLPLLSKIESTGDLPPVIPDGFVAWTHRPDDLIGEIRDAGLRLENLVGVEGLPLSSADVRSRMEDPTDWRVLLDSARAVERVPELLGMSPHLIATTS